MKTQIALETQILPDAEAVAKQAAKVIAAEARAAVARTRSVAPETNLRNAGGTS